MLRMWSAAAKPATSEDTTHLPFLLTLAHEDRPLLYASPQGPAQKGLHNLADPGQSLHKVPHMLICTHPCPLTSDRMPAQPG